MLEPDIIKKHLRIDADNEEDDEDDLIDTYSTAAQRMVESQTGRKLYATRDELEKKHDEHGLVLDDDITSAMLLYIGHLYANRESVVVGETVAELPEGVMFLVVPYRHYFFD